ncbi:MAG: low-complexity tail membrane protein [Stenomitos rutilans HA7619-LM2]|jgi:hypothetical protein|nr:low-complexity tail membrane protein [Stenomitos rutilans HA7619-LM2]
MRSFWSDPYLWIHLTGLAAVPLFVEGCLVGFALGDPLLPVWLELLLVAAVGIVPIFWMQWRRPFYIFSLVTVCLKPAALTDDQRRLLTLFKSSRNRVLAVLAAIALIVVLWKVYALAPIAASSVSFLPASRWLGLLIAAVAFLACNLFVQVPLSVSSVMLSSESAFTQTVPYPQEQIRQSFSLLGLQLSRILPPVVPATKPAIVPQEGLSAAAATAGSIETTVASPPVKPLTDDLWAEPAGSLEDSPIASDDQASMRGASTVDHSDVEAPETLTATDESLTSEAPSIADTSIKDPSVEPASSETEDDRIV